MAKGSTYRTLVLDQRSGKAVFWARRSTFTGPRLTKVHECECADVKANAPTALDAYWNHVGHVRIAKDVNE